MQEFTKKSHPTIAEASKFRLNEEEYNAFIKWLKDKDYDYNTDTEKQLEELKKTATDEKYHERISKEWEEMKHKLSHNKEEDLVTFKDDICRQLEAEIVARYYYQKGKIQHSLSLDQELKKAVEVLNNTGKYNDILTGKYTEPEPKE
jgi:carboxyl-terminal processing protease